jgi:hypothetical protein
LGGISTAGGHAPRGPFYLLTSSGTEAQKFLDEEGEDEQDELAIIREPDESLRTLTGQVLKV